MEKIVVGIFVLGFTVGIKSVQQSKRRVLKKREVRRVVEPVKIPCNWCLN